MPSAFDLGMPSESIKVSHSDVAATWQTSQVMQVKVIIMSQT
jgi:hypothetical protein